MRPLTKSGLLLPGSGLLNRRGGLLSRGGPRMNQANGLSQYAAFESLQFMSGVDFNAPYTSRVAGSVRYKDKLRKRSGTPRAHQKRRCYNFPGGADVITAPMSLSSWPLTLSCWYRSESTAVTQSLFSFSAAGVGSRYNTLNANGNAWYFYRRDADLDPDYFGAFGSTLVAGSWIHVVYLLEEDYCELWVDGVQAGSRETHDPVDVTDFDQIVIGSYTETSGVPNNVNGQIFDFRAFDRWLDADEITRLAALRPGVLDVGPTDAAVWFKCEQYNHDGTIPNCGTLGSAADGTVTAASISTFLDTSSNTVYSFGNEVGGSGEYSYLGPTHEDWLFWILQDASFTHSASGWNSDQPASSNAVGLFDVLLEPGRRYHLRFTTDAPSTFFGVRPIQREIYSANIRFIDGADTLTIESDNTVTQSSGYLTSAGVYHQSFSVHQDAGSSECYLGFYRANSHAGDHTMSDFEIWAEDGLPVKTVWKDRDEQNPTTDLATGQALTYTGPVPRDPRLLNPSLTFDGTSDVVVVPHHADLDVADNVSLFVRAKINSDANRVVYEKGGSLNHLHMHVDSGSTGFIEAGCSSAGRVTSTTAIDDGEWHDFLVSFDSAVGHKLWVDGNLEDSNANTTNPISNTGDVTIGGRESASLSIDGEVAQVILLSTTVDNDDDAHTLRDGTVPAGHTVIANWIPTNGDTLHDTNGDQHHGTLSVASEAAAYANKQDRVDTLTTDGCAVATRYSGTGEYYREASAELAALFGTAEAFSFSVKFFAPAGGATNKGIFEFGSLDGGGVDGAILCTRQIANQCRVQLGDNTFTKNITGVTDGQWNQVGMSYDGANVRTYLNGSLFATDPYSTDINFASDRLTIGGYYSTSFLWIGMIADLCFAPEVWSDSQFSNINAGTVPATAYRFPDGDGTETQQGLSALSENGTPDRILVPVGAGLPRTLPPGLTYDIQSIEHDCGEPDSPYAAFLVSEGLGETDYDFGDGNEADVRFVREQAFYSDRHAIAAPAATGSELAQLNAWSA